MSELSQATAKVENEARALAADVEKTLERVKTAIEDWYAKHFRRAAQAGTAPITADEKTALHATVSAAVQPAKE